MNIGSINNTNFGAKIPASRINIKTKTPAMQESAEEYFSELMKLRKDSAKRLTTCLDFFNKTVNLYFRGQEIVNGRKVNAVYINTGGPNTSRFDLEQAKSGKDLIDSIMNNINLNA